MADPLFDELNATTLREIYPKVVEDQFFKGAPFLAYLRKENLLTSIIGDTHMHQNQLPRIQTPRVGKILISFSDK